MISDPELDVLVAGTVVGLSLVYPTEKRSAIYNGCRVCFGVYVKTGDADHEWGPKVRPVPTYSQDVALTWSVVVERILGPRFDVMVRKFRGTCLYGVWIYDGGGVLVASKQAGSVARAICLAALQALGVEVPV
jgi:hypothetical protein